MTAKAGFGVTLKVKIQDLFSAVANILSYGSLDQYVKKAAKTDLRSRAAFKLMEVQEKYRLILPSDVVVGKLIFFTF